MEKTEIKYHVKFHLKSKIDYQTLQKNSSIELHYSSLRKIDNKNIIIDAYIPAAIMDELKNKYHVQFIGNVNEMIAEACKYVSKTNRFKNH